MPRLNPILLPAKNVPTTSARRFKAKVSGITRAPEGIIVDSPKPTKARNIASGAKAVVTLHKAVASDHRPTPTGNEMRGRAQSAKGPASRREAVNAQLNTDNRKPSSVGV